MLHLVTVYLIARFILYNPHKKYESTRKNKIHTTTVNDYVCFHRSFSHSSPSVTRVYRRHCWIRFFLVLEEWITAKVLYCNQMLSVSTLGLTKP